MDTPDTTLVYKTESDLRASSFTITIDLVAEWWPYDVISNYTKRQALTDAVFASNKSSSDSGYELALYGQTRNFSASHFNLISNQTLTITLPVLSTYAMPGTGSEVITTLDLPAIATLSQGADIIKKTGPSTVTLRARTAIFSGTMFQLDNKTEYSLKSLIFEVTIKLEYENWKQNIANVKSLRNALTDAIFTSTRSNGGQPCDVNTYSAYECAMETQRNTICSQDASVQFCSNIQLQDYCSDSDQQLDPHGCNTQIKISIPSMLQYRLPPLGSETISAIAIPALCTQGTSDVIFPVSHRYVICVLKILLQVGLTSVNVNARTAIYSGTFFDTNPKTDEDMQSDQTFTVVIDLIAETWVSNVVSLR